MEEKLAFHIIQYKIFDYRLYHKIDGAPLYDSPQEKLYLQEMLEHHTQMFCALLAEINPLPSITPSGL